MKEGLEDKKYDKQFGLARLLLLLMHLMAILTNLQDQVTPLQLRLIPFFSISHRSNPPLPPNASNWQDRSKQAAQWL